MSKLNNNLMLTVNEPAKLKFSMGNGVPGSYDGIRLKPKGGSDWRHPPSNVPLSNGKFFVPQGSSLPLKNEMTFMSLPTNSMFIFQKNHAGPECCPSTFSTDRGCVCTTKQQRDMIGMQRGNNKNYPNGSF